jgi:hypothetical protein
MKILTSKIEIPVWLATLGVLIAVEDLLRSVL